MCYPCVADTDIEDMCYGYQTCAECREDPACGWCDDGSGRGVGTCRVGGASGPLEKKKTSASLTGGHVQWIAADTCSATHQKSWHFTSCPGKEKNTREFWLGYKYLLHNFPIYDIELKYTKVLTMPRQGH